MDAVLQGPVEDTIDDAMMPPAAVAVAVPAPKKSKGGAGYCETCKCFISLKKPHTSADCSANIARREASRHAPKSGKKRYRMTPKRASKLNQLMEFAALGLLIAPKLNSIKKRLIGKKGTKSLVNTLSIPSGALSKKSNSLSRSIGLK